MSERMRKLVELGEDLRQNDIELGRRLERERIVALLQDTVMTVNMEWIVALIEGENE